MNAVKNKCGIKKLEGNYKPGYRFGNAKIHKNPEYPPLRPIISQISSPTYDIAKKLDKIIRGYMPSKFMLGSTYEFINIIKVRRFVWENLEKKVGQEDLRNHDVSYLKHLCIAL